MAKVEATRNYGASTVLAGVGFDEALELATAEAAKTGATFVHAFEDTAVMAGQGTIGLELAAELPEVETFLLPIGGGGLAAGIATALRAVRPGVRIVGVQAGKSGRGTIADGIAVKHPGVLTMAILDDLLDDLVHVEDEEISEAITMLLERTKLVVEGAGAASVAALLTGKAGGSGDVCALLSGGNIDPTLLISVMRHGLTAAGRYLVLRTRIADRPGRSRRAARAGRRRAGQRRLGRAPPRRNGDPRGRDGSRADRRHAQRGSLRLAVHRPRAAGLRARSPALNYAQPMQECSACGRESPSDARFCANCGAALATQATAREERKVVSVVFVDLVGHTARSRPRIPRTFGPLWPRITRMRARCSNGSAELSRSSSATPSWRVFGAPVAHEDDPERAVRAALAVRDWAGGRRPRGTRCGQYRGGSCLPGRGRHGRRGPRRRRCRQYRGATAVGGARQRRARRCRNAPCDRACNRVSRGRACRCEGKVDRPSPPGRPSLRGRGSVSTSRITVRQNLSVASSSSVR